MQKGCRLLLLGLSALGANCASSSAPPTIGPPEGTGSSGGASGGQMAPGTQSDSGGSQTDDDGGGGMPTSSGGPSSGGSSGGSSGASSGGSGGSGGSGSSSSSPSPGGDEDGSSSASCFPFSNSDFTQDGPLMATNMDYTSVSCTVFQPTVLATGGCLNPVVVWGNGTLNTPQSYTALFNHFATHGIITVAADTSNAGSGMEMLACLNWILQQNTTSGSPFEGHIDANHIASSGYSQGGAGCLAAGEDKRFVTVLAVSPYIVIPLGNYDPSTYAAAQIHPLFMISGSADTVATPNNNQQPIFNTAPVPIFWATHSGSTHFEVLGNGGAYNGPMTAWFRWKLMGDTAAEAWFEKPCDLCTATGWTVQTNSMWM
jgi:hypothetical protein